MARATSNKLYRNFTKGLITEASLLTYPENACIDIDNLVVHRKGNISRRLGLNYEPGANLSSYAVPELNGYVHKEFVWEAVANDQDITFLIVQTGSIIRFYDITIEPLSAGQKSFAIDMFTYLAPNATVTEANLCELEIAFGKGWAWVTGEKFNPILIEYDKIADWITVTPIYILMRDFAGVSDGLANDEEPATLSTTHNYNLLNQGWLDGHDTNAGPATLQWDGFGQPRVKNRTGSSPISDFFTAHARYPGNNKQWWIARDSTTNAFDPALLDTFFYGTGRAPRGHFILNAFYKDRTAASGVGTIPVEATDARPTATAFFSGRAWYVCESNVYFSQVLDNKAKIGLCYQEADPTAEAASDLIATDGGVIPIPEMGKALKAFPASDGLLIFANNGIWFISGTSVGFSALDFTVIKVSSVGTKSPNSIVDTKRGIYWVDRVGLRGMTIDIGQGGPAFNIETISADTIQHLVQERIAEFSKPYIKGAYDPHTNVIHWLYSDRDDGSKYLYNRILHFDLDLGAFYLSSFDVDTAPRLVGIFDSKHLHNIPDPNFKKTTITYRLASNADASWRYIFGWFMDDTFVDFKASNGVGYDFVSYLETGYELLDDAMRKKEGNYVFVYLRRTETEWIGEGVPDKPSSCKFQTRWNWADSERSNQWTNKIEVYRHTRLPFYDEINPVFDTGYPLVITRNKVRGHGKAIQFRFESGGPGKNFDLLGWAVAYSGNTDP